jgi:AraC-like DNA-binding protein
VEVDHRWDTQDVYSSFWRLYVNNRSGAKALLPNGEFVLTPGRVHIIPAWVRFSCYNTRHLQHCYIHFDVLGLSAKVVREVFNRPMTLPRGRQLDALQAQWVRDMRSFAPQNLDVVCTTKALIFCAVGIMMRALSHEQHARCCRHLYGQQHIAPAVEHIDNNLDQPLENEKLAQLCHLSDDHFIRVFRKCTGQTPAQYVLDRRVTQAAQKLIFSTDSVDSIAEQTGFCDRFYFTRVFTRRMGLSPAAYRKADRI